MESYTQIQTRKTGEKEDTNENEVNKQKIVTNIVDKSHYTKDCFEQQ